LIIAVSISHRVSLLAMNEGIETAQALIAMAIGQSRACLKLTDSSSDSRKITHEAEQEVGKALSGIHSVDQADYIL